MKVRALPKFEGIKDLERTKEQGKDIFPKAGDEWETTEERAMFLKEHGVVEIVEEVYLSEPEPTEEKIKEEVEPKKEAKKTTKKKKQGKTNDRKN